MKACTSAASWWSVFGGAVGMAPTVAQPAPRRRDRLPGNPLPPGVMKVLFVHDARQGTPFNCSIAALSAYLEQAGVRTALAFIRPEDDDDTARAALSEPADVIALSWEERNLGKLIRSAREGTGFREARVPLRKRVEQLLFDDA